MTNSHTPTGEEKALVTEADRKAAADAVIAYRDRKNSDWQQRIRDGKCDDGEMVQAFARHRLSALRTPEAAPQKGEPVADYSEQALADCCIDFLEERADEWMKETGVQRMFNALASVFEKHAPQEIMDRFRAQMGVVGRQCHVEGALRVWEEISAQQRALGMPLPALSTPVQDEVERERLRYIAACIEAHADKFPVPVHMRQHARFLRSLTPPPVAASEPVAYRYDHPCGDGVFLREKLRGDMLRGLTGWTETPLYAATPPRGGPSGGEA